VKLTNNFGSVYSVVDKFVQLVMFFILIYI